MIDGAMHSIALLFIGKRQKGRVMFLSAVLLLLPIKHVYALNYMLNICQVKISSPTCISLSSVHGFSEDTEGNIVLSFDLNRILPIYKKADAKQQTGTCKTHEYNIID